MSVEKRVHDNFPLFSHFLKSHNSHEFCNIWANLNCECTHMHILTVVNNCLIYCPGCILQNHLRSRPAWADCFYGPPNEIRVLFSSDAMPYLETHFSPESCEVPSFAAARSSCGWNCHRCGLQTRENSWSLSPLQRALVEQLPPSPPHSSVGIASSSSFTPWACFFKDISFPSSTSFSLICRRRQLAWSHVRNN